MNVDALLACRVTGSRLHGKPVQNLTPEGPMIIESLVSYLKEVKSIRKIALCIAEGNENLVFQNIAEDMGLPYMFGPEDDVLKRLIKAGNFFDTDVVFRITSEGPFVLHSYADELIEDFINGEYDWGTLDQSPEGTGYELIKLDALKKSHINGTERNKSELVTSYICENQQDFKKPLNQLIIAIVVLSILIFVDALAGFLLVCALLVIYYNVYGGNKLFFPKEDLKENGYTYNMDYITPANLDNAQNNIFNEDVVNKPYMGFVPENNMKLYSAQGYGDQVNISGYEKELGEKI